MNLQEQIYRIQEMMGLLNEEKKSYENKPIILIGPQGTGKSTTSKTLAKKLKIPHITTDMSMVDKKYEKFCKNKPGVKVKIKRHPTQGVYYDSNDEYVLCVLNKLMDEYGNKKIVLDVGGTHAYASPKHSSDIVKMFTESPNLFVFNVNDDEDESYEFLKKRRKNRGDETKNEDEKKFKDVIKKINNYYKKTQKISIINKDKSSKTTNELVDEIIDKLK